MLAQKLRCLGITPANCGVISGEIDSYEWAPNQTMTGSVATIHITGTVYAVVHSLRPGSADYYYITTMNISTAGEFVNLINWAVNISTAANQSRCSVLKVSQTGGPDGDCVIAIWSKRYDTVGERHDIICRSWRISQAGVVNGEIDNLEMGSGGVSSTWSSQALCRRSSGTNLFIGVGFSGDYRTYIYTFEIGPGGTFGTLLDEEIIYDVRNGSSYVQAIISGGNLIVNYRRNDSSASDFKSYFMTDPGGQLTYLHTYTMETAVNSVFMLDMYHMGFNGFIAAYRDNDSVVNKVVSHTADALGNISAPIDTLSIGSGSANGITLASLTGNGIIASWRNSSNKGYISTFTMDTNGYFSAVIDQIEFGIFTSALYQWDHAFLVNGSSPTIYGLIYSGNSNDGFINTWGVTNVCT